MPDHEGIINIPAEYDRKKIRTYLASVFCEEEPGTGKGEFRSVYKYTVEKTDRNDLYIKRPTRMMSMDFTIHVENIRFREKGGVKTQPSHAEIISDLSSKKNRNSNEYKKISKVLKDIYDCTPISENIFNNISLEAGLLTPQEVCLTVKWLFIEQDMMYWNYSGRAMFYKALLENELIDS